WASSAIFSTRWARTSSLRAASSAPDPCQLSSSAAFCSRNTSAWLTNAARCCAHSAAIVLTSATSASCHSIWYSSSWLYASQFTPPSGATGSPKYTSHQPDTPDVSLATPDPFRVPTSSTGSESGEHDGRGRPPRRPL